MSTTKHTAVPWTTFYDARLDRNVLRSPEGNFGHFCGWSSDCVTMPDEDEANAEFIVRACNSHEELVEALQRAQAVVARPGQYSRIERLQLHTEIADLLAKAGVTP